MKLLTVFFVLTATVAIVAAANDLDDYNYKYPKIRSDDDQHNVPDMQQATSLRRVSRFLLPQNLIANIYITCDKFPRVCRLKSSPGPDCCKKKCVNVKTDQFNCGMCRYKCKYTEICCKGKCVNALFDKRHCGGCNKKCKKGELCSYGMCNYA